MKMESAHHHLKHCVRDGFVVLALYYVQTFRR